MTKKNWTDTELDCLAWNLMERYPERGFASVKQPYDINLSDVEFTPVLQACLPPERHGVRPKLSRIKRDLVKAFDRVAVPAQSTEQTAQGQGEEGAGTARVRWGQDDWRFCALALHTMCPELDLVNAPDLSKVTLHQLNLAASAMEQGRQRKFKRLADAADRLAQVYKQARENRDPFYFGRPEQGDTPAETADTDAAVAPQATPEEPPQAAQLAETPETAPAPEKLPDAPAPVLPAPVRPQIYWTADEYKAIAAELRRTWPRALEDGFLPGLNITDLNIAIRKALPPERQRRMANQAHIRSFGNRLRDALAGKPIWTAEQFKQHEEATQAPVAAVAPPAVEPAPAPAPDPVQDFRSGPRVFWSAEEWDTLIRLLYAKYPQVEARFRDLTLSMLNDTAQRMERPRRFFSVAATLKHLEPAVARVKQAAGSAQPEPLPAAAAEPTPAPAPPNEKADKLFVKIEWTRQEWLLIAEELHKLFPAHNYPYGQSLVGLDTDDVAFAQQRVLPLERQRRHLKVVSFSTLRAPLERAFADLHAVLEGKPPACVLVPAAAPAPAAVVETAPPVAPVAAIPASVPAVNPYEAAFAPLMALLGAEVAKHLGPMIQTMVEQAVAKLPAPVVNVAAAPAAAPGFAAPHLVAASAPPKNYGDEKPRVEKTRRLVVGILVNREKQYKDELERTFPMVEIRLAHCDEKGSLERFVNVDRMIGMERFVNHTTTGKIKKLVGDRYVACNGAMSELKRIISMWLASQGIQLGQVA